MNWSVIITSSVSAALVAGVINHITRIHAIKESGLYAKRVQAIDTLSNQFTDLDLAFKRHNVFGHGDLKDIRMMWDRFAETTERSQHYLPRRTAEKLISIKDSYIKILITKSAYADNPTEGLMIIQEALEQLELSMLEIRNEFRNLLGVRSIISIWKL